MRRNLVREKEEKVMGNHNAVVQVFVQASDFNWAEPYKTTTADDAFGTAFFISEDGYLISNFHVINRASSIEVQLPSLGRQRLAIEVVGVCPFRDIALLRLTDESLKIVMQQVEKIEFLELGDSDVLRRSEKITTLGYPLGQEALKATDGIVSGRQDILGESFLQITAALNPGNSGGPSLNEEGKVVGINSSVVPDAQNIGYIIPISDVASIIKDLFKIKMLRSPILGCELNYGTADMLNYLGNPEPGGLYVARVYEKSLLEQGGVQEGDMIYQVEGFDLGLYGDVSVPWSEDRTSLATIINRLGLGEKVHMMVYRKGKKIDVTFTFSILDPLPIRVVFPPYDEIDYEVVGGMVVTQLTLNHVAMFGNMNPFLIDYRVRDMQYEPRLVVSFIIPNSQTSHVRIIYPGDLLEEVNGRQVTTLQEFRTALAESKEFLTIKTRSKKFMVLSWNKIMFDEVELSKKNMHPITPTMKKLLGYEG